MDPQGSDSPMLTKRLTMKSIWVEEKWPSRPRKLSVGSSAMSWRRESHGTEAGRLGRASRTWPQSVGGYTRISTVSHSSWYARRVASTLKMRQHLEHSATTCSGRLCWASNCCENPSGVTWGICKKSKIFSNNSSFPKSAKVVCRVDQGRDENGGRSVPRDFKILPDERSTYLTVFGEDWRNLLRCCERPDDLS